MAEIVEEIEVSVPQEEILQSSQPLNLFLAGSGSGKTHSEGLLSANFIINFPKVMGFIGANTYQQLSKSTLFRVYDVWWRKFGWKEDVHFVVDKIPPKSYVQFNAPLKSYENTISFNNGCLIFLSSLDNYKIIDGSEFGWAILDETKDTKEVAVKEVVSFRLRQKGLFVKDGELLDKMEPSATGHNPMYIFTSPAKVDWLNEWFGLGDHYEEINRKIHDKKDYFKLVQEGKKVVICSTFHNEHNLPEGWIARKLLEFAGSPNLIEMLIYGSPVAKSGGEFFSGFERLKHVKKVPYIPAANIHITLDFNVVPYITMTLWQIIREGPIIRVRCFDEIKLTSPKNNTEALCREVEKRYLKDKKIQGLYYYGDATGKNRTTSSIEHNYEILERVLKKYLNDNSNRVLRSNPSVSATRDFVNRIFGEGTNIRLEIDENCKTLISDLEFLKEDADGGYLKVKVKDAITGSTYEKYGHMSDNMRYFLVSAFNSLFEEDRA